MNTAQRVVLVVGLGLVLPPLAAWLVAVDPPPHWLTDTAVVWSLLVAAWVLIGLLVFHRRT